MNTAPPEGHVNGLALCAGIGGLELGLRLAMGSKYRTVGYVERDAFAASVLVARMADEAMDCAPVWDDLATFDGSPWRGIVDIISSGFPCQPWSQAGKRRGTADKRWLWPDGARVVREVGPGLVFLENVAGFVQHGLGVVLGSLAELGYAAEWALFSAAASGAPHRRQRLFLLAANSHGESLRNELWRTRWESWPYSTELADSPRGSRETIWKPPDDQLGASRREPNGHRCAEEAAVSVRAGPENAPDDEVARRIRTHGRGPWSAEPAVVRVVHGLPHRVDRIQCLGNAVVPLVAARAFRTLAARLLG